MTDLFGEPDPVPIGEQIREVEREIALRERVYHRWVESGRLTVARAEAQLTAMRAVLETLRLVRAGRNARPQPPVPYPTKAGEPAPVMTLCAHGHRQPFMADFARGRTAKYPSGKYCLACGEMIGRPDIVLPPEVLGPLRAATKRETRHG